MYAKFKQFIFILFSYLNLLNILTNFSFISKFTSIYIYIFFCKYFDFDLLYIYNKTIYTIIYYILSE